MINHNPFLNNPYLQALQQNQQLMAERNNQNNQGTVFIPIHSDNEVLNYPVAPGNSVYFKHENKPYIYIKSMGINQFDTPKIVKFKLIEEEMTTDTVSVGQEQGNKQSLEPQPKYLVFDDLKPILDENKALHEEIENIKKMLGNKDKPKSNPNNNPDNQNKEK